ncbi:MAG TPA: hypothetical protein VGL89_06035 [Candidatus Koribacter sp.]|jgi:uncharacterized MnhB-related membrane protein
MTAKNRWWIAIATLVFFCVDVAAFLIMLRRSFPVAIIAMTTLGLLAGLTFVQFQRAWKSH